MVAIRKPRIHGKWTPIINGEELVGYEVRFFPDMKREAMKVVRFLADHGLNAGGPLSRNDDISDYENGYYLVTAWGNKEALLKIRAWLEESQSQSRSRKKIASKVHIEKGRWVRIVDESGQTRAYEGVFKQDDKEDVRGAAEHLWSEGVISHQKYSQPPLPEDLWNDERKHYVIRLVRAMPFPRVGDKLTVFEDLARNRGFLETMPSKQENFSIQSLGISRTPPDEWGKRTPARSGKKPDNTGLSLFD